MPNDLVVGRSFLAKWGILVDVANRRLEYRDKDKTLNLIPDIVVRRWEKLKQDPSYQANADCRD